MLWKARNFCNGRIGFNLIVKMPTVFVSLTAGPEAVSNIVRRQCSLCASDVGLKALRHHKNRNKALRRRLAPARTLVSSSLASKAIDGVAPAAVGTPKLHRKPQVLAPAGGWPQLKAAVENGADAVYLGLSDFNARARAVNFTPEELPEVSTVWRSPLTSLISIHHGAGRWQLFAPYFLYTIQRHRQAGALMCVCPGPLHIVVDTEQGSVNGRSWDICTSGA